MTLSACCIPIYMAWYRICYEWPLRWAAYNPCSTQKKLLDSIIRKNRITHFGKEHHFDSIENYEDFQKQVPIQTYEALHPYIEEQAKTGNTALTYEPPLLYACTSGTTGTPKYIPVVPSTLRSYKKQQYLLVTRQYRACPEAFQGKTLAILGPGIEGFLPSGQPFGSVSGFLFERLPDRVRDKYVIPAEVFNINDYALKYKIILRLALAERDITQLAAVNPSTLLRLLAVLNENRQELLESLATGHFPAIEILPVALRNLVLQKLIADTERANVLAPLLSKKSVTYADIWPDLKLVTTWTGGSCGIALEVLKTVLPKKIKFFDLGYISSEFRGTYPIDCDSNAGWPTLLENFFEFVERNAWENGLSQGLLLENLEAGKEYYIIVTNHSGLYRYFINDIVRVVDFYHKTPLLAFIQKGKGVTNITGEKLYEAQLCEAIKSTEREFSFSSPFFIGLANETLVNYEIFIESNLMSVSTASISQYMDEKLQWLNIEYAAKRQSGRLGPLVMHWLKPNTMEAYARHCIGRGQRESQFKVILLQYRRECHFSFHQYIYTP